MLDAITPICAFVKTTLVESHLWQTKSANASVPKLFPSGKVL